ncbi:MAG: twin-arginine translocation pathway signal protein [Caulobacteraceae bacterium]|nr:twin-arginine translocation pathway signal protein [Caulobacteraceae bacterium]
MSKGVSRRGLLTGGVALPATLALSGAQADTIRGEMPWREGAADPPHAVVIDDRYIFFTPAEAAFIEAAAARLIPKDELGPGALEAGAAFFLDRQLAGDYGQGGRWYMQGPWAKGEPTQGYQTRMTPAQLYRAAIKAIDDAAGRANGGKTFAKLGPAQQDALLRQLEAGQIALDGGVDAKTFFAQLLQNTLEGFFSDPIYGGNRDMAGWKLIGFPGVRYDNTPFVKAYGQPYPLPPVGIGGRPEWSRRS